MQGKDNAALERNHCIAAILRLDDDSSICHNDHGLGDEVRAHDKASRLKSSKDTMAATTTTTTRQHTTRQLQSWESPWKHVFEPYSMPGC